MNGNDDDSRNTEDSLGVSWGASYDLGVTKPMILVQYGKNENKLGGFSASTFFDEYVDDEKYRYGTNEGVKGYAIALGTVTPLFGGNLYTSVNYTDGEYDGDVGTQRNDGTAVDPDWNAGQRVFNGDIQRWGVAVGYDYPLSKRTKIYGFAAYNEGELKATEVKTSGAINKGKIEETDIEAGVGLIHYF